VWAANLLFPEALTDFLQGLNDVQRQAVLATEGPVMVLAGAGSGKTRVITYRIAHLIRNVGVLPQNILALTFTNKAAGEMRQRIDSILEYGSASSLWIGTFHSVFARLLRSYIHLIGYDRNFSIFDADDSKSLIKQCMKELNLSPETLPVNLVHSAISKAKNSFVLPPEFHRKAIDDQSQKISLVYERYVHKLRENNALDFDDLLIKPIELFTEQPRVLEQLQDYFKYLLIDEYQDTNRVQYLVAKMIAEKHRNIFVVGDDAQSIYSWRGADISNILNFNDDYGDAQVFKLVDNYRSTKTILDAANSVISRNTHQIKKELVANAGMGEPITLIEAFNEKREAEKVAEHIKSIRLSKGAQYRSFVVFYRTNAQSRVIEDMMRQNRIPYKIFGSVSFYKRKEIKDAVAYMRLVLNDRDSESLLRVINFPPRKIGDVSINKLKEFAEERNISLYEAVKRAGEGGFQARLVNALTQFTDLIEAMRKQAEEGTAYDVLSMLYETTGLLSLLKEENTPEALARHENLQELLSMTRDFADHNPNSATLGDFLSTISLASDYDETQESDNYVSLMTVHAAKGLEFPVVFVTGMEEKRTGRTGGGAADLLRGDHPSARKAVPLVGAEPLYVWPAADVHALDLHQRNQPQHYRHRRGAQALRKPEKGRCDGDGRTPGLRLVAEASAGGQPGGKGADRQTRRIGASHRRGQKRVPPGHQSAARYLRPRHRARSAGQWGEAEGQDQLPHRRRKNADGAVRQSEDRVMNAA